MAPKSPFDSKTLWVNGLTLAATLLAAVAGQEWIKAYPLIALAIPIALAAVNFGLRFFTDSPISINPPKPEETKPTDTPILNAIAKAIADALADGAIDVSDLTKSLPEILAAIRAKREAKNAA